MRIEGTAYASRHGLMRRFLAVAVFAPIGLCGCTTVGPGPERIFTVAEDAYALKAAFAAPDFGNPSVGYRNSFITARMYAIDVEFTRYFAQLTQERQLGTFGGDLAILGLTAATTLSHGEALKTGIAAVSTAVAGAKTAIDKDILVSQSIQVLQSQMEASRLSIKTRIMSKLTDPAWDGRYTIALGLSDLEDYYRAGTLAGALEALTSSVGGDSQAQKDIQNGIVPLQRISFSGGKITRRR